VEKERLQEERIQQLSQSLADRNFGDVMVVGGGISGIQASLDLATAGFKVYLVEKDPAIGGHMAQPLAATWPSLTRPFPPMTAPCEFYHPNWSRSAGIRT